MSDECQPRYTDVRLGEGGRIVIPAEFREVMGAKIGDRLVLRLEGRELHVFTIRESIRQAQAIVREWIPNDRSLSDELIAERRAEAARE